MAGRQRDNLLKLAPEDRAAAEQHRIRAGREDAGVSSINVAFVCDLHKDCPQAQDARGSLNIRPPGLECGSFGVQQHCDDASFGKQLLEQFCRGPTPRQPQLVWTTDFAESDESRGTRLD
jgi:hypothetical protein